MRHKIVNNKGFSLMELLGVIVILGILLSISIMAYSRYRNSAAEQSYDTMAQSAVNATEEYLMDNPGSTSVSFQDLYDNGYMSSITDPKKTKEVCTGLVEVSTVSGDEDSLDENSYDVHVCCKNYNYTYSYPGGNKVKDSECKATAESKISKDCSSTSTKSLYIYTMDYKTKVCTKNSSIKTYRQYDYKAYKCYCEFSTVDKLYCDATGINTPADSHNMRIYYLADSNGYNACTSNDVSMVNKYVDHVCTYGTYELNGISSTVLNFHGYQFYKVGTGEYNDFDPDGSWFHDYGDFGDRVPKKEDESADAGCKRTCLNLAGTIS